MAEQSTKRTTPENGVRDEVTQLAQWVRGQQGFLEGNGKPAARERIACTELLCEQHAEKLKELEDCDRKLELLQAQVDQQKQDFIEMRSRSRRLLAALWGFVSMIATGLILFWATGGAAK